MSNESTEQTENVRSMLKMLADLTDTAVKNNVAHATATSNAWRDAVDMVPKTAGSLDTLLLQLGGNAAPIIDRTNGRVTVSDSLRKLRELKLVFDTATRQMLLKKAVTSLTNLDATLAKLPAAGSGGEFKAGGAAKPAAAAGAGAGAGSAAAAGGSSAAGGLYRPMPEIQKATVVFNPDNMRTGAVSTGGGGDGINRNIKPKNFMTFSSAESSASARLGVTGKCAVCNAHREVGSVTCPGCGKNTNIVF